MQPNFIINQIMNDPRFNNNQIMQNAFAMYRNGDLKGLESLTRNVCQSQGKNLDEMIRQAKSLIGK